MEDVLHSEKHIPSARPKKPLRLSNRLVQTPWQDFHRAAGVMEWCSDKSQTTAALLMLRNEVPQGPVSIYLGQNDFEM